MRQAANATSAPTLAPGAQPVPGTDPQSLTVPDCKLGIKLSVDRMETWRIVVCIVHVSTDDQKPANPRHALVLNKDREVSYRAPPHPTIATPRRRHRNIDNLSKWVLNVLVLYPFTYSSPTSMDELLQALAKYGASARVFSGGTDLFVAIRSGLTRPEVVIDLKHVPELGKLSFDDNTGLSIGACVTVNQLVAAHVVQQRYAILATAGHELATFQLRNRATVVGNIVTASPCGDMSSPLLCLGARVELVTVRGTREMPLVEFITGVKTTQIADDEIVSRIVVPTDHIDAVGGYKKLKRIKGHDLGVVSVAMLERNETRRFAISSAAPTPVLLPDFASDAGVSDIQAKAQEMISPIDDVRCTKEYRAFMVDVFIRRLIEETAA